MENLLLTNSYKKDLKTSLQSGKYKKKDFDRLNDTIEKLKNGETLDASFKNHKLTGNRFGTNDCKDCHILSNWVLVYRLDKKDNALILLRLGTHNQLNLTESVFSTNINCD